MKKQNDGRRLNIYSKSERKLAKAIRDFGKKSKGNNGAFGKLSQEEMK